MQNSQSRCHYQLQFPLARKPSIQVKTIRRSDNRWTLFTGDRLELLVIGDDCDDTDMDGFSDKSTDGPSGAQVSDPRHAFADAMTDI
jgi:hypothetical protein